MIKGWPDGLPLVEKIFCTASGLEASAANPYTVSLESTSPPFFSRAFFQVFLLVKKCP